MTSADAFKLARRIPRKYAELIDWLAGAAEPEPPWTSTGLPTCDVLRQWESEPHSANPEEELQRLDALEAHADQCPTCRVRAAYVRAKYLVMPAIRLSPGVRLLGLVASPLHKLGVMRRWVAGRVAGFTATTPGGTAGRRTG